MALLLVPGHQRTLTRQTPVPTQTPQYHLAAASRWPGLDLLTPRGRWGAPGCPHAGLPPPLGRGSGRMSTGTPGSSATSARSACRLVHRSHGRRPTTAQSRHAGRFWRLQPRHRTLHASFAATSGLFLSRVPTGRSEDTHGVCTGPFRSGMSSSGFVLIRFLVQGLLCATPICRRPPCPRGAGLQRGRPTACPHVARGVTRSRAAENSHHFSCWPGGSATSSRAPVPKQRPHKASWPLA